MKVKENPFSGKNYSDDYDQILIAKATNGDRNSLSELVIRHQQYIFNIAMKMINNVEDAEDVTQEILVKLVTSLAKYDPSKGKFRTWLYRITFNHFLNIKKQSYEKVVTSFDIFFDYIDGSPNIALSEMEEKEMQLEIEESKVACMAGMLMCLDREQRLTYIVGEVFEIDHQLASEIFEITPDNFRQKLSRARKDLHQWMHNRCGLVNTANPCRCPKKTKGFIKNGWVSPENMKWHSNYSQKIKDLSETKIEVVLTEVDDIYAKLYKEHPFKIAKKSEDIIGAIINNDNLRNCFKLKEE
ncbi:RNA polymerase sigma factor [Portibacter marinus]|uniref:RNA polymerase sigma factor n=1 Tax=Portibacter marinus TaxID=2898660 RepID=UPI001F21495D|nr:RNA polymerase sigma factor [Portibacter marinus]